MNKIQFATYVIGVCAVLQGIAWYLNQDGAVTGAIFGIIGAVAGYVFGKVELVKTKP